MILWPFAKLGAYSFGGGYGMIPLIRVEIVTRRAWLSDQEFTEILGLAQTAPGVVSVNTRFSPVSSPALSHTESPLRQTQSAWYNIAIRPWMEEWLWIAPWPT